MASPVPPAVIVQIAARIGRDPSTVKRAVTPGGKVSSPVRYAVDRELAAMGLPPVAAPCPAEGAP